MYDKFAIHGLATPQIVDKNGLLLLESFRQKKYFRLKNSAGNSASTLFHQKKITKFPVETEFPVDTLITVSLSNVGVGNREFRPEIMILNRCL